MADCLLKQRELNITAPSTVQVTAFETAGKYMIHFINETGERPIRETIPVHDIQVQVMLSENVQVKSVHAKIEEQELTWEQTGNCLTITLHQLDVWEMITIAF